MTDVFGALTSLLSQPFGAAGVLAVMASVAVMNSQRIRERAGQTVGPHHLFNGLNLAGGTCFLINAVKHDQVLWGVLSTCLIALTLKGLTHSAAHMPPTALSAEPSADWPTVTVRVRRARSRSPWLDVGTEEVIDLRADAPVRSKVVGQQPIIVEPTVKPTSRSTSPRIVVAACYWLTTLVDGAARIILPLYLLQLGVSASGVGLAFLASEGFGLLATIGAGVVLNRAGYRRAFLAAIVLHLIASLGYLLVFPELEWAVVAWVSGLRACRGLAKELIKTASTAYFKHLPSPGRAGKKTQVQLLLGGKDGVKGLGFFIGGVLLHLLGATWSFAVLGAVTAAALAAAIVAVPDHREKSSVVIEFGDLKVGLVWLGLARAFLYSSRDVWMVVPVPLYLAQQGNSDIAIGGLLAVALILLGGSQPAVASMVRRPLSVGLLRVKRRWRFRPMVALMPLAAGVVPAALLFIDGDVSGWVLASGVLVFSVLMGAATVPHNRLHVGLAREDHTSLDLTVYKSIAQVGKVVSVAASGVTYSAFGLKGCLVASLIALAGATACGVEVVAIRSKTFTSRRSRISSASGAPI